MRARAASLCLALTACAPAAAPPPVAAPPTRVDPGPTSMESEIGGMNEEATDQAFAALARGVERCLVEGSERLGALGGTIEISLRIRRDGTARWAYARASTLGDRATERCVIELALARPWPKPVGGEGLATKSFELDAREPPLDWSTRHGAAAGQRAKTDTAACRRGLKGAFTATAHVGADGRVVAAGVAPPDERGEAAADCVVEAVRRQRFPAPGAGKRAKLTFVVR
jgi:hypothetical protein